MRIAFIGTGGIAARHADSLAKRNDVTFVGAFDAQPDRAQGFAARYGGAAYSDVAAMLDEARPDAVWVCLPPSVHGPAEMALLERRIPFFVEKPISNALDTARGILNAVERTGTLAAVGYMNRYRRGVNRARELLAGDPPALVYGGWVGGTPGVPWWRVRSQSGGQIVEQTTHIFDVVRYLVGEPRLVYARAAHGFVDDMPGYDVDDASAVSIEFANGAVGSLISSCVARNGCGAVFLSLAARQHHVAFTGWELAAVIQKSRLEEERIAGEPNIFEIEADAFVEAVRANDPARVLSPYADAIKTLAFCLAANQSLETGEPVEVVAP